MSFPSGEVDHHFVVAQGENEGQTFSCHRASGRDTIFSWLRVEGIAGLCLYSVNEEHIARIERQEGWGSIWGSVFPTGGQGPGRALPLAGLHVPEEAGMEQAAPKA